MTPEGAVAETVNSLREMYGTDVVPEVSEESSGAAVAVAGMLRGSEWLAGHRHLQNKVANCEMRVITSCWSARVQPVSFLVSNWSCDEFARGAYG